MTQNQIIIDPICLIGISTFHQKSLPTNVGGSYGIIYALQKQLQYHICMSSPLGTSKNSPQEIINRLIQYQILRAKKSKHTINYMDQFILMGWYVMGPQKYCNDQNFKSLLNKQFSLRGGHYHLVLDSTGGKPPKFYKQNKQETYSAALQPMEKICSDSMHLQTSKQSSALKKSLNKQQQLLNMYIQKTKNLYKILKQHPESLTDQQKRKLLEVLGNYERLSHQTKHKAQTIESINYSVISGLTLAKQKIRDL